MLKFIHLILFYAILFKDLSESIRTPLIVFNNADSGIHYDNIQDFDSNGTIVADYSAKLYYTDYRIKSFDYDLEDKYVVWSGGNDYSYPIWLAQFKIRDVGGNETRLQITKRSITVPTYSRAILAVDWVHNLIYYYMGMTLSVLHIDNPEVAYGLTHTGLEGGICGAIIVNPKEAFIVWTEYNLFHGSAIMRKCNGDGSEQKILVYKDIRVPKCIAIDYNTNSILWIDNELHSLSSIDYFGDNRKTLKQSKDLFDDCSAMDILEGYVYWSSPKNNAILRINLSDNDSQEERVENVVTSDSDIDFVKIISQTKQKMSQNYCSSANCSHICLPVSSESYRCLCSEIPQLETCNETEILHPSPKVPELKQNTTAISQLFHSKNPLLLFTASKRDIRLAKLSDNQLLHYMDSEFVYKLDSYVSTIDFSISGNFLVWFKTDVSTYTYLSKTTLMGSPIDETANNSLTFESIKPMLNLSSDSAISGMAIDWVHNLVYFPVCDLPRGIFVKNLSTPQFRYLVVPQTACVTKDVRVDPIESYLFWSEYHEPTYSSGYSSYGYRYRSSGYRHLNSGKGKIKRSTQDGLEVTTLVEREYIKKNSLTLDLEEKKVYWVDLTSGINKLFSVDYTGHNIVTINPSTTLFNYVSSMDLYKDHIYWVNSINETVLRISKRQSTETEAQKVLQSGVNIDAIKIIDSSRQPNGTNKCLNHTCVEICLPSKGQNNYTCFCPSGQSWNISTKICAFSSSSSSFEHISSTTMAPSRLNTTTFFSMNKNETKLLFVIFQEGIYVKPNIYDLNTYYKESFELRPMASWITELDYDFKGNYMLWLQVGIYEGFTLYAAPIDHTRKNDLGIIGNKYITSRSYGAKRLAFDWIHRLVYISSPKGIEVFTIKDKIYNYDIISHNDTQGDLAVDPVEGLIFWSQFGYNSLYTNEGCISRANQDGSDSQVLTSSTLKPTTLTIDTESKTIYWIDTNLFVLYSMDYQGHNQNTVLTDRNIFYDAFSMDVFGDNIFWSNYEKNAIFMTEKSGANGSNQITLVNSYTDIEGVKILDSSRQSDGPNRCLGNNCTAFELCLPVQQEYRCVCPKYSSVFCSINARTNNTQNRDRNTTINPINSQAIHEDHISKKLDEFHALLNSTVLMAHKSESNHLWVTIIVILVAVILILIVLVIYRKKRTNPFSKYIMAKFKNDKEEILLDERVSDDNK